MARRKRGRSWVIEDYRYGENLENRDGSVRPVYDPRKGFRGIYHGQKREQLVTAVRQQLEGWKKSPFEFEGSTRAGLRSGLCLGKHPWAHADLEAVGLIEEALASMGARRPTYEEGQRRYVLSEDECAWCSMKIPDDLKADGRRFCSEVCAHSAAEHLSAAEARTSDRLILAAKRMVRDYKSPELECDHCGRHFHDANRHTATRKGRNLQGTYCSITCFGAAIRTVPERTCEQCGTLFRPHGSTHPGRYCSRECHANAKRGIGVVQRCEWCGWEFEGLGRFCSTTCRATESKFRLGHLPTRVGPLVFDHFFSMPINSRPPLATPERFDELLAMVA